MRQAPQRTCVGCRETFPQQQLLRIAAKGPGGVSLDLTQKMPGRGAYLCYSEECLEKAKKRQSLQRALRCPLPEIIWIEIDQAVKSAHTREE